MIKKLFFTIILFFALTISVWSYTETHCVCTDGNGAGDTDGNGWANCFDGFDDIAWDGETEDADDGEVGPNDKLELRDDDGVYRELLTIGASGLSGKPITIGVESGDTPIIRDSDLVATWTSYKTNQATNPSLENWTGDAPDDWNESENGTSVCTEEVVDVQDGSSAAEFQVDAGGDIVSIQQNISITADRELIFSFYHKETGTANEYSTMKIVDGNYINYYLQGDGTWDTGSYSHWTSHSDTYAQFSISSTFVDENATVEWKIVRGQNTASQSCYIDNIHVDQQVANKWQASLTTEPHNVWMDGTRGIEDTSIANLDTDTEWFWSSNILYQYSTSDPDTRYTTPGTEAGDQRNYCIRMDTGDDYITIDGLTLEHAHQCILVNNADNVDITNCTIQQASNGIGIIDGSTSLEIYDNTLSYFYYEAAYGDGGAISHWQNQCQYSKIYRNTISYADGYGIGAVSAVTDGESYDNLIHHCGNNASAAEPYGIVTYGNSWKHYRNIIRDQVSNEGYAMWFGGSSSSAYCNLIYDNADIGIYVSGGGSGNMIYNNTVYGNSDWGIAIGSYSNIKIKNNIVAENTTYEIWVHANGISGFDGDYNCVYHSGGGNFMYWNGTAYNWADWKTQSSGDGNSASSDPLVTNASSDDYTLQPTSPAINVATNLGATYDDALAEASSWPSSVSTVDQDDYGYWEMGAYAYPFGRNPAHQSPGFLNIL